MKTLCLLILVLPVLISSPATAIQIEREGPDGLKYVEHVLKFKGTRRHRIKKTNDAEQLFIIAVELLKKARYAESMEYLKKAIEKDHTYLNAHFILASLYERAGNLEKMEKEYRYFLEKSVDMRKWQKEMFGSEDKRFKFIKKKFDYYDLQLKETTFGEINIKYWSIGALFALAVILIIVVLMKQVSSLS